MDFGLGDRCVAVREEDRLRVHECTPARTAAAADRTATGIPQELEDIILKAIEKGPDKRFQSAHEFRKALLKVGMVHVRAYRRLKALRREKDKAAFSASPAYRQEESVSFAERLRSEIDNFLGRKTLRTAGIAMIVVLGISTALWLKPAKEPAAVIDPVSISLPPPVTEPQAAPDSSVTTPVAVAPGASAKAALPTPEKAVEAKAAPKPVAAPAQTTTARPVRGDAAAANPQPPKKQDDQKYDSLKKAWGG